MDISISSPVGTSFSGGTLTVNADNVTIDGYDFTLWNSGVGVAIACVHNNLTVTNCKFNGAGTHLIGGGSYIIDFQGSGLSITKCSIDGQSQSAGGKIGVIGQSSLIISGAVNSGNVTLQYNWFKNYCQHIMETGGSVGTLDYRFNLIDDTLIAVDAHMNWLQWANSTTTTCATGTIAFNTSRQITLGGSEAFQWGPATTGNVSINNNTLIAKPNGGTNVMSCFAHVQDDTPAPSGGAITGSAVANNNYCDTSGLTAPANWGHDNPFPSPWTTSGNINMNTGGAL